MYKAVLGTNQSYPSTFLVQGLPPLQIRTGREGYFDGFIASASSVGEMWLTPSFEERNAIIIATRLFQHQPLKSIQRGTLAVVRLQYGNTSKTWTRVLVESRPDPAHAQVYLLDYGARQLVNARSLCEMPIEMKRFPPQAFPIIPKISAPPDLGPGEWEKLNNVRITVRIKAAKDGKFICDQLTVFDAITHTDLDLGAALRSGIDLERSKTNITSLPIDDKNFLLGPQPRLNSLKEHTAIALKSEQRDFSVLLVCVFGILMAVASIMIVVGFTYKRIQVDRDRRRRRRAAGGDNSMPRDDANLPPWGRVDEQNMQHPSEIPNPTPKEPGKAVDDCLGTSTKPSDENKGVTILPISPRAIAAIAALMGSSSAIVDKQLSRTIAIGTGKENSIQNTSYTAHARLEAGTSKISPIRGSSSGALAGFVTSTPIETSSQLSFGRSSASKEQSSRKSSSLENEYIQAITPHDVQRVLNERAITRLRCKAELNTTSLSSFISAMSSNEQL
ncbi:hypothetical protein RB195_012952 [Necator americanus]|uniref:Tudor domain-containing protein n=1 Tax=Necator americanus TaxID=51031 RepID=A0ABR1DTC5_NECAM